MHTYVSGYDKWSSSFSVAGAYNSRFEWTQHQLADHLHQQWSKTPMGPHCENTNDPKIKVCKYSNGTYTGEMKAFRRHGQGEYIWNSGKTYKGEWIEGKAVN